MRYLLIGIICFLILSGSGVYAETAKTPHPFSVHDLLTMDRISGVQVSANGQWIAFVLRKTDLEANKGRTDLWLVGTDGKGLRRLTADPASDYNPCWSKDGKTIYFLSSRSQSAQVWKIAVEGGEAFQVTKQPLDVGNLMISPDGTKMAFTMEVFPNTGVEQTKKELEEIENRKVSGRIYTRIFIRHWDTWMDGRRSHIFVMPIEGGTPVDVMKTMDADSPVKPFGGPEEFTFTPDSKGIVFTAANSGQEEAWSTNFDLFLAPADGSAAPKCLTEENKAWDTQPVFSPDGKTLAYLAMKRPGFEADRLYIKLRSWPAGGERILAETWDRSPSSIVWGPRGRTIYANAPNLGQKSLFAIDVKKGTVNTLVKDGNVTSIHIAGKRVVYGINTLKSPVELYSIDMKGKKTMTVTAINAEKLAMAKMGDYEQFTFKGWNDETVYCYVVKPVDFDPQKKYPVAFLIHGGPQGSFGNRFHYRWNPHKPLEDLKKGLAAALERYPWMDGDRVAALGASFGGYMINWIAGRWPDRFRCLVNHDGNLDERFAYYDTEELWFPEWDHGGTPWDKPGSYEKQNPVNYVKNWKTPMLVIHGALDFRVVETQGFATFNALQRRGIPSKLLYFPDENHWVLKPHNSIFWHDTVLAWLDQWTK
jgi:dipeptidyl aminopeptidase/acylaminoacyl peptidase